MGDKTSITQNKLSSKVTTLPNKHSEHGFTLIELLIALVLGLLISAAAIQVFFNSSVNQRRQQAGSQIQDNAVFGVTSLQRHIRRANYGAKSVAEHNQFYLNHQTPQGGVVLTAPDGTSGLSGKWTNGNLYGLVLNGKAIGSDLLTHNESSTSASNLELFKNSDQLTIQYQAGRSGMFDCQGREIPENFYVIERYFVRQDTSSSNQVNGLACASAIYEYNEAAMGSDSGLDISSFQFPGKSSVTTNNLDGKGTVVIPNVDYFRVLLGVSDSMEFATDPGNIALSYIPIPEKPAITLANLRIVSLNIGLLMHSSQPVSSSQANNKLSFSILDRANIQLNQKTQNEPTYLRNVSETTVLLRNARGGVSK